MISIIPTTPTQLNRGKPFGFKTKNKLDEKKKIEAKSSFDKFEQDLTASLLKTHLDQFTQWPCEVQVSVSVSGGIVELKGEVRPYEGKSQIISERIVQTIEEITAQFADLYPKSSITISFKQTVEITAVHHNHQ